VLDFALGMDLFLFYVLGLQTWQLSLKSTYPEGGIDAGYASLNLQITSIWYSVGPVFWGLVGGNYLVLF
jgi:hypothetical protein